MINRLAMHQEWFDKNQNTMFLESRIVMQELLAMCRQYKAERDKARRETCYELSGWKQSAYEQEAHAEAKRRGWDCFKENA